MTNTVAKTYRLPSALYKLILEEVEQNGMSEADFVRSVLRNYFVVKQEIARLDALESRVINAVEKESRRVSSLIQQVIALAQPE